MNWESGAIFLNDYIVESILGRGGMGIVYLVRSGSGDARFAVKRVLPQWVNNPKNRRKFIRELLTWSGLPTHPHLTKLKFFRSLGEEMAIFAEYVQGGSLKQWIAKARITTLEEILDVAIQVAWGLQVTHKLGYVHQDIKPGNILMTPDGTAKITDFSLTRSRAMLGEKSDIRIDCCENPQSPPDDSLLVSCGGCTPAYCSPEQAAQKLLTHRSDIWSWGLVILEMFRGGVSWLYGISAPTVLQTALLIPAPNHLLPDIPQDVADVLRRCFEENPENRWNNIQEAADRLIDAYPKLTGKPYKRTQPTWIVSSSTELTRQTRYGVVWRDPREAYSKAVRLACRTPYWTDIFDKILIHSKQMQLLQDMILLDETAEELVELIRQGHSELVSELGHICLESSYVHQELGDHPGALSAVKRAIESGGKRTDDSSESYLFHQLNSYLQIGSVFLDLSKFQDALESFQCIEDALQNSPIQLDQREFIIRFCGAALNKVVAFSQSGRYESGIQTANRALSLLQNYLERPIPSDILDLIVKLYANKASILLSINRSLEMEKTCREALDAIRESDESMQTVEFLNAKSELIMTLGSALFYQGKYTEAFPLFQNAIQIREDLVFNRGNTEARFSLANGYLNHSVLICYSGDLASAIREIDKAVEILNHLIFEEGRSEYLNQLIYLLLNKGSFALWDHRFEAASDIFDRGLMILNHLDESAAKRHHRSLARLLVNKSSALKGQSRNQEAAHHCAIGITLWERIIQDENSPESLKELAQACFNYVELRPPEWSLEQIDRYYNKVIEMWRKVVNEQNLNVHQAELAWTTIAQTSFRHKNGLIQQNKDDIQKHWEVLTGEAVRSGRSDLKDVVVEYRSDVESVLIDMHSNEPGGANRD